MLVLAAHEITTLCVTALCIIKIHVQVTYVQNVVIRRRTAHYRCVEIILIIVSCYRCRLVSQVSSSPLF